MNIENIPLSRLIPSAANARKSRANLRIEELAASIAAHGLLQNLQVRVGTKGKFEVVAGGRRLAALKLLVKQKAMAKDAEIPCHILGTEDAGEISLAENIERLSMHPADQFAAFHAMAESGKGVEDIAARFGTTAVIVRQRLKLAAVSPSLMELYRNDEMSLDQLTAFCVSDDHTAQEAAWFDQPEWNRTPSIIRRTLTAAHVSATDSRARFVTIAAYQAAGGGIVHDLFTPEHDGYLTDPALLDRLVIERLEAKADTVRAEGWKWVEIVPRVDYATLNSFGRVAPERLPLANAQQEELDQLNAAYNALVDDYGDDDLEPEIAAQICALSEKLDAMPEGVEAWQVGDLAIAGAIVSIGHGGDVKIQRGLLRAEDRKIYAARTKREIGNNDDGEGEAGSTIAPADPAASLSARLVENLTAERTAALRATMQDNERVALVAVAHTLALQIFYPYSYSGASCLDLRLISRDLKSSAETITESGAEILLAARDAAWLKRLPEDAADLFGWLLAADSATVTSLIAFCGSMSIDAVRGKQDRHDCPRLAHADQLGAALKLDMALWWEPTKERYLGRVPKALILNAVAEAVSRSAANNLATLKKSALLVHASEKLAGKGWLPPILRSTVAAEAEPIPLEAA